MYCPECGTKIEEGGRFCPECGTMIAQETHETTLPQSNVEDTHETSSKNDEEPLASVIILTNVRLLAEKMDVKAQEVRDLIEKFIEIKAESGLCYTLVDAGEYKFHKKGILGTSKKVSLNAQSEIWDYMDILMDTHKYEVGHRKQESQYLFIVGGDDIIPMPCVKHYIPNDKHDDSIDTDILYAYPYGKEMLPLLENQEIFKYDQMFFVGRLPLGNDATFEDLADYLQRDIDCTDGIPMTEAYGQCDPNWKNVSVKVSQEFAGYMRNLAGKISAQYYYNRMILSPDVHEGNVTQVFHTDSSLYYYNLHGSNAVKVRGYAGAARGDSRTYMVIQPEHLALSRCPNVVVSEACYGARFIDLDRNHSMLLSAIHNQTMTFVGSSRVAWGAVDGPQTTPQNAYIGNADIIARTFTSALLQGYTAGQAMFMARSAVLQQHDEGDLKAALTVVEFNLYGDPLMFLTDGESNEESGKSKEPSAIAISHLRAKPINPSTHIFKEVETQPFVSQDTHVQSTIQELHTDQNAANLSILERVRGAVNDNIAKMHQIIGEQLYAQFGLTPRPAESILKICYGDGREEYDYTYKSSDENAEIQTYISVTMTAEGTIKNIYTSK